MCSTLVKVFVYANRENADYSTQVFTHCESVLCAFTFLGYNSMFGARHCKSYCESDVLCGSFIRDARCARELNHHLDDIYYMCTV